MSQCLINVLSGRHVISAPLVLSAEGNVVTVNGPVDSLNISGAISGGGGLTKTGSGMLTLTGSDTYCGATIIAGGTLQVGNGGSGASIGNTSSIIDDASLVFNQANNVVFSAAISGDGSVTKDGAGMLTLTGTNIYTGGTILENGNIVVASASALPDGGDLVVGAFAALLFDGGAESLAQSALSADSPQGELGLPAVQSVPEPSSISLLAAIASSLLFIFRLGSAFRR
jgi:autotransporter-associated beta strand protein